jgi:hypothetical protein
MVSRGGAAGHIDGCEEAKMVGTDPHVGHAPVTHPALGPLARLVGTWRGDGEGAYPTIEPFTYREEVVFAHDGRPVLSYRQRTWRSDSDEPMHAESGFLRGRIDGRAELVVAQPTGFGEVATLVVEEDGDMLVLDGGRSPLQRSPSARAVEDVRRRFRVVGDELHYDLWMTYAGNEDVHHLRALLRRV